MRSLLLVLCLPSLVHAAPCAPPDVAVDLFATGDDVLACFASQATCVDAAHQKEVARPAAPALPKLGKKAQAAVDKATAARAKADPASTSLRIQAGGDGKWLVINAQGLDGVDASQLWNIAKDRRVSPPKKVKKEDEGGWVSLAGNLAIGNYVACAGPCAVGYLLDDSGRPKGKGFPGGEGVMLDDKRALVVPEQAQGQASVIDAKTGKVLQTLPIGDGQSSTVRGAAVKLSGDDVAIWLDEESGGGAIARVSAPAGKAPTITGKLAIPACAN